jgi:hypothetical protein
MDTLHRARFPASANGLATTEPLPKHGGLSLNGLDTRPSVWWPPYQTGFKAFVQLVPDITPTKINKQTLQAFIFGLRERGIFPVTCNTYAKTVTSAE